MEDDRQYSGRPYPTLGIFFRNQQVPAQQGAAEITGEVKIRS